MNVTLEVSVVDLIKALSGNSDDPAFVQALADATEMQKASQDDFVSLFGEAFQKNAPDQKLAAIFITEKTKINFQEKHLTKKFLKLSEKKLLMLLKELSKF